MDENLPNPPIDEAVFEEHRVFPIEHGGKRFWAKYGGKNYANRFLWCMGKLSAPHRCARATLRREVKAIEALQRKGFLVPDVVMQQQNYILLSDIGPILQQVMREADTHERLRLVTKVAHALRALHDAGHWHGAAALKNMTLKNETIGFLDFESAMHRYIGVHATQWLDLWQLACSVAFFDADATLVPAFLKAYGRTPAVAVLRLITLPLLPIALVLKLFQNSLSRDVRQFVRMVVSIFYCMI